MNRSSKALFLAILFICLFAIAGVSLFIIYQKPLKSHIGEDLFTTSYQFLLIIIAGGAISLLYREFSEGRKREKEAADKLSERKTRESDALKKMYSDLTEAYNSSKKIRRLLRAKGLLCTENKAKILLSFYDEQMTFLMDIQLKIEFYKRHINCNNDLFGEIPGLFENIHVMEDYLRRILKEYEKEFNKLIQISERADLEQLPYLEEFIGPSTEADRLWTEYIIPFEDVLKSLATHATIK